MHVVGSKTAAASTAAAQRKRVSGGAAAAASARFTPTHSLSDPIRSDSLSANLSAGA